LSILFKATPTRHFRVTLIKQEYVIPATAGLLPYLWRNTMNKSHQKTSSRTNPPSQNRRLLLKLGGATLATGLTGTAIASVSAPTPASPPRQLRFYNTHTGEQSNTVYWADGIYQPEGLMEIDRLLRDHRSNQISNIDTRLLDLLCVLSATLDTDERFHVISGYRSPASNALLRGKSQGVAKHSLHMEGLAIDIRIPGRNLADLRRAAIALKGGGVGYYPASDFVHVDVGNVRTW
jgi:uncharacterized protein YcbK (DUF882 family)